MMLTRLDDLPGIVRVGLIVGGYVAALVLAVLVLVAYVSLTSGPDRDASSGMYAFADGLLFLLAFALAALAPTALALYFLRAFATPWRLFSVAAVAMALTGLLAVASIVRAPAAVDPWSALAVPRIFLAPLLAGLFALVGLFSPSRRHRGWLFAAAGLEAITSAYGFAHWFLPLLLPAGR